MRAHLARHVCRRYLVHGSRAALRRFVPPVATKRALLPTSPSHGPKEFSRGIFGVFREAPREVKKPEYEPGWSEVLTWQARVAERLRPPSRFQLVKAFEKLFDYKIQRGIPVNSTQAQQCYRLFRYLVDCEDGEERPGLTLPELQAARDALLIEPNGQDTEHHLMFSKELYLEIQRQRERDSQFSAPLDDRARRAKHDSGGHSTEIEPADEDFRCYLQALVSYGESLQAASILHDYCEQLVEANRRSSAAGSLWMVLLRGLAKEGRHDELLEEARVAQATGIIYGPLFQEVMTTFFAKRDLVEETKFWFEQHKGNPWATTTTYAELIRFSMRNGLQAWLQPFFKALIDLNPSKGYWDIIFEWTVLSQGEGIEGVKQMIHVMVEKNQENPMVRPDIDTINALMSAAVEQKNTDLAERFVALARELNLRPNATTYILQMGYHLDSRDISAARLAYLELRNTDIQHDEDLPILNKYLQALCATPRVSVIAIYEVLKDLEQRDAALDPETVVAVCMTLLKDDDQFEVIDTLAVHVHHYSAKQRELIHEAFVQYVLNPANSTSRVWDGYQLLVQFFAETPRPSRLRLMKGFFDRKRPDMAVKVFVHMKDQEREKGRPYLRATVEDYVHVLEGLGRCPDSAGLETIYNLLKLDTNVQPCTKLLNALMIAFSACRRGKTALRFWKEISESLEGPSYESLEIVFAVCERLPFGEEMARRIWQNVTRMEIDIPPNVFNAYCGAIASSGDLAEVADMIKGMSASVGYGPDMMTLGIAYNALPNKYIQVDFEEWAEESYPELWKELTKKGLRVGKVEHMNSIIDIRAQYKISRVLKA